jgi:patatin-related protein
MVCGTNDPRRELRFALVLYGGVSLCIYMHGTTKEINRLVRASARLAAGIEDDSAPTESVYRELLMWLARRDRVRTEISVDVIAGTSAGGINGIYLAKALVHDLSQDSLRDLWLEHGDLTELMRGIPGTPWQARIPGALMRLLKRPALNGVKMARLLYGALEGMDAGQEIDPATGRPPMSTLMPAGASLDLMVTMTDFYGYQRQVAITDPKTVHDDQSRHIMRFSQEDAPHRYGSDDNLALAFAARATSCFPGAFEPVSPAALCDWVSPGASIGSEFFRVYELSGYAAYDQTRFIDGGVLDNRPFAPAIEALRRKPAHSEVRRWMLYLEPDPAAPLQPGQQPLPGNHGGAAPGPPETILGALVRLPRKQPILDNLLEVEAMNERVRELRDVIEASFDDARSRVKDVASPMLGGADAPPAPFDDAPVVEAARSDLGVGYATYLRARVATLTQDVAEVICAVCRYPAESNHARMVHVVLRRWAELSRLFERSYKSPERQRVLLDALDVNYAVRRVRFTVAGVNWLYDRAADEPVEQRRELDVAKAGLWGAIAQLEAALSEAVEAERELVLTIFPQEPLSAFMASSGLDPDRWLAGEESQAQDGHRAQLDALFDRLQERLAPRLGELLPAIYEGLRLLTDARDLRVRYVGFALFDAQLYPLEYAAGVGERDRIDVMRMSPRDSGLVLWPDSPKVKGTRWHHFGAFMKRQWRENDYLAGRFDGAERMVSLLIGEGDLRARDEWCARAFMAILEEEQSALTSSKTLIEKLKAAVAAI